MRKSVMITLPIIALLSACQDNSAQQEATSLESEGVVETSAGAAKDAAAEASAEGAVFTKTAAVSPSVAPGVAFQYQYHFRVPGDHIEAVQDEHAAACETLGLSRCQITGLNFRQGERGYPEGHMQFLLDPAIARKFGRDAIATVEKAEGVLATSNVQGDNVGDEIASSQVRSAGISAEVKRIEGRLAGKGLAEDERVELRRRAEELREMLGSEKDSRRTGEKRLATTPVSFSYSGNMGIGGSGAFGEAFSASTDSMTSMLALLLMLVGVVLPWLLPVAAIVLLIKSPLGAGLRRWWRKSSPLVDQSIRD